MVCSEKVTGGARHIEFAGGVVLGRIFFLAHLVGEALVLCARSAPDSSIANGVIYVRVWAAHVADQVERWRKQSAGETFDLAGALAVAEQTDFQEPLLEVLEAAVPRGVMKA